MDGQGARDPRRESAMAELIDRPEFGGTWLMLVDGIVAGYLTLTACYSLEFHGAFGLLDELFVEEAYRGQGIGKAALSFVDEQCRARRWKAVRLEVSKTNVGAMELYRKSGYRAEERYLMTRWV